MAIVLGVDPGVAVTGYGVLEAGGTALRVLEAGVVRTRRSDPLPARLLEIFEGMTAVLRAFAPDVLAMEALYSSYSHPRTAILMGHARGVVCVAAGGAGVPVVDYPPARVKKNIIGEGRATKAQIQRMVALRLGLAEPPHPADVADALAVAVCHVDSAGRAAAMGGRR